MRIYTLFFVLVLTFGHSHAQKTSSYFVTMNDGVNLALDVHLPEFYAGEKLPVLVIFTRYWRSSVNKKTGKVNPALSQLDQLFSKNGYVIVKVDVRGTGASFGTRPSEYSPIEVMDAKTVVDWIIQQTWSNGKIGSYGTSYEGTTAELLCAINHPAVKAVIPGWSDFDVYRSPVRPYGMLASSFIRKWGFYVRLLDRNRSLLLRESIRPVHKDSVKPAVKQHKNNPKIFKQTKKLPFRNSKLGNYTYLEISPIYWKNKIEESNVPMLVLTSWMDAGTAEGTLLRLSHYSNPQKVLMMATSHGGWSHASPFVVADSLKYPVPRVSSQDSLQLAFFDQYLKGEDKGVDDWPLIKYYTMGEERYHESDVWPLKQTHNTKFYFQDSLGLSTRFNDEEMEADNYKVNFSATTGEKNRWTTQMGGPVLNLNHRNEEDEKMIAYTSEPMKEDVDITGTPIVSLRMSSNKTDGAVFVYLEDVDENGVSRYITEGGLRLIHRKISDDSSVFYLHSFNEEDALPMVPGQIVEVMCQLWPTSVQIKKGHRIRVSIAGADKNNFDKIPKHGKPTFIFYRNGKTGSFIELPVVK